ncbi:MAG: electron transfer flavoprotein subunit alpha/FixB family protein, partial [Acidobacteriota bacterium]|nr:electron transfer flavoprotein subunit alpha/FixB family protein [Acidobacteriota bacterium]
MSKTIWAVVQVRDGALHPTARETLAGAQHMARMAGGVVEAVALGSNLQSVGEELSTLDLGVVRLIEHANLEAYTPGAFVGALKEAIRAHTPDLVLFPHSYQSVDFVPRLAQETGAALVPEVMSVRDEGGEWLWRRPVFGGKLQCDVKIRADGADVLVFATLQAGAYSADDLKTGSSSVERLEVAEVAADREILGTEEVAGEQVDLSQADIILAVGRGLGDADKMTIIQDLATALGAELGASRPVIDSGWLERDRQIGSSGQVVTPKLYVAVGIS